MKYSWFVAIAILPSVGAAASADAMTYKDIAGQWCGDVTDYIFTPDTLTVKFHDRRPANVFKITKYTYTSWPGAHPTQQHVESQAGGEQSPRQSFGAS